MNFVGILGVTVDKDEMNMMAFSHTGKWMLFEEGSGCPITVMPGLGKQSLAPAEKWNTADKGALLSTALFGTRPAYRLSEGKSI